ncbi:probable alpha-galactosidase B isoform X3 [Aegilops tauschii subsp. strangulata]|nr:probable alpha-galactosidase B isoform X3 [Aegilops tauschii subsp. strangulata]
MHGCTIHATILTPGTAHVPHRIAQNDTTFPLCPTTGRPNSQPPPASIIARPSPVHHRAACASPLHSAQLTSIRFGMELGLGAPTSPPPWRGHLLFRALVIFLCLWVTSEANEQHVELPPRGWNSYDSFSWTVDENAYLQNAKILAEKLLPHGYQYAVIDYLWYRRYVDGAYTDSYGFDNIDEWGRPFPDLQRFPSSKYDKGFSQIANKVHEMGLKFGIHLMKGISTQAVNANTPILDIETGKPYVENGRQWAAHDIGLTHKTCAWMPHGFMSVNTDIGAGWAFLRSLYRQYADWGVDFVKVDCIFGTDYSPEEVITISQLLRELDRPIVLSISPGTEVTVPLAENISEHVNMYRITGDDWDNWKDVSTHFTVTSAFAAANKIGATGLRGKSWPDLDMLPFGWLTDPGVNQGPHRPCNLTFDEQKAQMTLWSMAKSPLIYGGDLRHLDNSTFSIMTNPTLLKINYYSKNNMEFHYVSGETTSNTRHSGHLSPRYPVNPTKHDGMVVGLTSCTNDQANGWFVFPQDGKSDHICRIYETENGKNVSFCLGKTKPLLASDDDIMEKEEDQTKFHLAVADINDSCLDASASRRRTASEVKLLMFSRCKWHARQMWELNDKGNLVSSYSRLCATVESSKEAVGITGARAWIATGSKGNIN